MDVVFVEELDEAVVDVLVCVERLDFREREGDDDAGLFERRGFCQHDDLRCLFGERMDGLGAHEVVGHEAALREAVGTHENLVDAEVGSAFLHHRPDQHLRFVLVFSSEEEDMRVWLLVDEGREKGGVRDDGHVPAVRRELFGEQRAAGARINQDGFAVVDGLSRPQSDAVLSLVIK